MSSVHRDPEAIAIGTAALRLIRELAPSLVFASLLTDDGFELAHAPENTSTDSGRFASMSSSVQALSEAVTRELAIGTSEYVVIASAQGHVVQMRVPGQELILAALFDTHELLGKALSISKRSAEQLGTQLAAVSAH